jgi:hypothetical protein
LELNYFVQFGASGGGVFFDGYYLANNWYRRSDESAAGVIVGQYTIAALGGSLVESTAVN